MKSINRWLSVLFMLTILSGCIKEEIPEDIMSPEKMKMLLKEFHLANALTQRVGSDIESRTADRQEIYTAILQREGETRENFLKSYVFYLDHPNFMDEIYTQIVAEFNEEVSIEEDFRFNKMLERKDEYVSKIKGGKDSTSQNVPQEKPKTKE